MAYDVNRTNFKPGTHPRAKPDIIAHQGKVLWKCNVCFRYNPQGVHQCDGCGMKNPMFMGVQ